MTVLYLEALAAIAVSLSVLMAGAWVVQQRTGNSGWVDTIWTFSLGLVGVTGMRVVAGRSWAAAQRKTAIARLVLVNVPVSPSPLAAQMLRSRSGDAGLSRTKVSSAQ